MCAFAVPYGGPTCWPHGQRILAFGFHCNTELYTSSTPKSFACAGKAQASLSAACCVPTHGAPCVPRCAFCRPTQKVQPVAGQQGGSFAAPLLHICSQCNLELSIRSQRMPIIALRLAQCRAVWRTRDALPCLGRARAVAHVPSCSMASSAAAQPTTQTGDYVAREVGSSVIDFSVGQVSMAGARSQPHGTAGRENDVSRRHRPSSTVPCACSLAYFRSLVQPCCRCVRSRTAHSTASTERVQSCCCSEWLGPHTNLGQPKVLVVRGRVTVYGVHACVRAIGEPGAPFFLQEQEQPGKGLQMRLQHAETRPLLPPWHLPRLARKRGVRICAQVRPTPGLPLFSHRPGPVPGAALRPPCQP